MDVLRWDRMALDAAETICVFATFLALFGLRRRLGVIPFAFALGALSQAAVWSREIAGAAAVTLDAPLLTTTIVFIVVAYLREDVSAVRQIAIGTLASAAAVAAVTWLGRIRAGLADDLAHPTISGPVLMLRLLTPVLSQIVAVLLYEGLGVVRVGSAYVRIGLSAFVATGVGAVILSLSHHYGDAVFRPFLLQALVGCGLAAGLSVILLVVGVRQFGGIELDAQHDDRRTRLTRLLSWREKYEIAREQAVRDALTGLRNRGYFDEALEREVAAANRYRRPMTLLMIDIDHFKRINDHHGHRTGDAVLRQVAEAIESELRAADLACRYGGEEIAVILPETDGFAAGLLARRLHASIGNSGGDGLPRYTATIGVATYPIEAESPADLVSLADRRLYDGKGAGRNCIVTTGGFVGQAEI